MNEYHDSDSPTSADTHDTGDAEEWHGTLTKEDWPVVNEGLYQWIRSEHSLIASRLGWLLTANAFLFSPIAILLGDGHISQPEKTLAQILCGLGICLAAAMFVAIRLAVCTIEKVIERQKGFLKIIRAETVAYHFFDPDQSAVVSNKKWQARRKWYHNVSMCCQQAVPIILLLCWIVLAGVLWGIENAPEQQPLIRFEINA